MTVDITTPALDVVAPAAEAEAPRHPKGFRLDYELANARPAEYNPRVITPEQFEKLVESTRTIGMVKPIIVDSTGLIIAGHQRTKAMRACGITHCPAHVIDPVGMTDEIAFNQLHNASDVNFQMSGLSVPALPLGWHIVKAGDITAKGRPRAASKFMEVCKLLTTHGPWGNAVVDEFGQIVGGQLYAYACATINFDLHVCVVPQANAEIIRGFLDAEYGKFSYEHFDKHTWVQSLAQPFRLRQGANGEEEGKNGDRSRMWETEVLPRLAKTDRLLDFGAGQMDYVKKLQKDGYDVRGVEFYRRKKSSLVLDPQQIQKDIDRVCAELAEHGLYDCVTCDSVINSVDTMQAEHDVFCSVGALCKRGGTICLTGRSREEHDYREESLMTNSSGYRNVHFYDDHGFTGMYMRGVWVYQKWHTMEQAVELGRAHFTPDLIYDRVSGWWSLRGRKSAIVSQEEIEDALRREFNLPWPDGKSVGRGDDIVKAYRAALEVERAKGRLD